MSQCVPLFHYWNESAKKLNWLTGTALFPTFIWRSNSSGTNICHSKNIPTIQKGSISNRISPLIVNQSSIPHTRKSPSFNHRLTRCQPDIKLSPNTIFEHKANNKNNLTQAENSNDDELIADNNNPAIEMRAYASWKRKINSKNQILGLIRE